MVASIPNDIFQFSTYAALQAGFNTGQPRTADLTTHGTHGLGVYEDGRLMLLADRKAFILDATSNNKASPAPLQATLPFAMVTIFHPTAQLNMARIEMHELEALISSHAANTLMPFKLAGKFHVVLAPGAEEVVAAGHVFGFVVPAWMQGISGPRVHAHFLDDRGQIGGRVCGFSAEAVTLGWAKCGRFHLGFPQGEAWEEVKLG
jgi:alpha-acetolactate decarboxylase